MFELLIGEMYGNNKRGKKDVLESGHVTRGLCFICTAVCCFIPKQGGVGLTVKSDSTLLSPKDLG
jgi:hypothetical protein